MRPPMHGMQGHCGSGQIDAAALTTEHVGYSFRVGPLLDQMTVLRDLVESCQGSFSEKVCPSMVIEQFSAANVAGQHLN